MHAINRIAAVAEQGVNIVSFGYDAAQSIQPINQLKAWLQTLFQKRGDISPKDLADVIQRMVVPVSQTAMTQNPRIGELEHMILGERAVDDVLHEPHVAVDVRQLCRQSSTAATSGAS